MDAAFFAQIRFNLLGSGKGRPVAASSRFIDDTAYRLRDMSDHTLDKVRRENEIIVERSSGGVVIARAN